MLMNKEKLLSEVKQNEADSIKKKIRSKYETEIDEMDLIIEKAKKDKGQNQKGEKKNQKEKVENYQEN